MNDNSTIWALVLAAGEGSRLKRLTTTANGTSVPKQFCSLRGGSSLLQDALRRARAVAGPSRVCSIVAEQHRRWWSANFANLPAANVIVQPENLGTANGILLSVLNIAARDPDATVLLLPADHYVRDEHTLATALHKAASLASASPDSVFLLGIEPDSPDTELGYIVPHGSVQPSAPVREFVEKPASAEARSLLARGALWNAFIIAASARAILSLYQRRCDDIVSGMRDAVRLQLAGAGGQAIDELYRHLPTRDFSRDIFQSRTDSLRVVRVPDCGWTDLGTPQRVAATLQGLLPVPEYGEVMERGGGLSLAAQHWRLNGQRHSSGLFEARP